MLHGVAAYVRRHHIALLALFFALGGTAFAAGNALLPKNSVGTAQLKNGAVIKSKISGKTLKQLKGARGVQGVPGPAGPQGPQGPAGAPNPNADTLNGYTANALGRIAMSQTLTRASIVSSDGNKDIGAVTITVPAVAANHFVYVSGSVTANVSNASCPCNVGYELADAANTTLGAGGREFDQFPVSGGNQRNFRSATVFSATPGTHTYYMSISTASTVAASLSNLHLIASLVPFGSSGGTTLGATSPSGSHSAGANTP
jgi:hypothetical protein